MSDSKMETIVASDKEWTTKHNMVESHAALYQIFCESRAAMRAAATADDESRREEFFKTAHDAGMEALKAETVSAEQTESVTVSQLCDRDTVPQETGR